MLNLKKLFGGAPAEKPSGVAHGGFLIFVEPMKDPGGYRVAATIEKGDKSHKMVRADVVANLDEAKSTTLIKAKHLIDQQGDAIFD